MSNTDKITPAPAIKPAVSGQEIVRETSSRGALKRKERDALFDAASNGMTPEQHRKEPADPLRPWAAQILRKHKQGFSPRQIVMMARAPGINLKVSVRAIRRLIAEHAKQGTVSQTKGER